MTSMNVPEPVMSLAVQPVSKDSGGQVSGLFNCAYMCAYCICWCPVLHDNLLVFFFDSFQRLWIVFRERTLLSELGWMLRVGRSELLIWYLIFFACILIEVTKNLYRALQCQFIFILSRQLFLEWESCIWTYMLNAFGESIRCLSFLSLFMYKIRIFHIVCQRKSAALHHVFILCLLGWCYCW